LAFRFVSDVTPPDIGHLFTSLSNSGCFGAKKGESSRDPALDFLLARLAAYYGDGQIIIRSHNFWTTQHSFWRLPTYAPDLMADLEESDLLVFKGDLNYRKYVLCDPSEYCAC
jgi:damage-control phosphatase, subfamily III